MERNNWLAAVAFTLAIIGALNWGLVGFFNFNLVDAIFGGGAAEETSTISRVIYALVGLAGIGSIFYALPFFRARAPGGITKTPFASGV